MRNHKKLRQAVCACRGFLDITGNTCPANAAAQQIGNLQRKVRPRTTLSFRTSAHTGVGISIKFRAVYRHTDCFILPFPGILPRRIVLLSGRLPRQSADWLAMTGNSTNSNLSFCCIKPICTFYYICFPSREQSIFYPCLFLILNAY